MTPDLDQWLARPTIRIAHSRDIAADPDALWAAASAVRLSDAGMLGRLVRWRIPGLDAAMTFERLFRDAPFIALDSGPRSLVAGLVGRIWTLRRDYPALSDPDEFRSWSEPGTARVLFANWVEGNARLSSEARVDSVGLQGRIGLAAVRPLVAAFHHLILTDGLDAAVRRAEAVS
jgi:hypothetical protein